MDQEWIKKTLKRLQGFFETFFDNLQLKKALKCSRKLTKMSRNYSEKASGDLEFEQIEDFEM